MTTKKSISLGLLLAWVITACVVHDPIPPKINADQYAREIQWIHEGRELGIFSFYILDSNRVAEWSLDGVMDTVNYRIAGDAGALHQRKARFFERMLASRIKEVAFTPDYIEVATFIVDSSYEDLKRWNPDHYYMMNFDLEDRDPDCTLRYVFYVLDRASEDEIKESLYNRSGFYMVAIVPDSVYYYRDCLY